MHFAVETTQEEDPIWHPYSHSSQKMSTFHTNIKIAESTSIPDGSRIAYDDLNLSGSKCPLDLYFKVPFDPSETVMQVKKHVAGMVGVPATNLMLTFGDDASDLPDDKTLFQCGIQSMSTLTLTFKNNVTNKKTKGKANREDVLRLGRWVRSETKRFTDGLEDIQKEIGTIIERFRSASRRVHQDMHASNVTQSGKNISIVAHREAIAAFQEQIRQHNDDIVALRGQLTPCSTGLMMVHYIDNLDSVPESE